MIAPAPPGLSERHDRRPCTLSKRAVRMLVTSERTYAKERSAPIAGRIADHYLVHVAPSTRARTTVVRVVAELSSCAGRAVRPGGDRPGL